MALTTTATLTAELFDMIAQEMLIVPDDEYLFVRLVEPQKPSGIDQGAKTIQFNAPDLLTGSYGETDRRLTDGTDIDAGIIPITASTKSMTIREYGGPHDGTAVRPIGITDRLKRMAKHELASWIAMHLSRDRTKFVNKRRMDDLLSATNVVTPNGDAEGVIGAGVKASAAWLRALNKKMKDLLVPRFANGRWRLIIDTTDEEALKADPELKTVFNFGGPGPGNPAVSGQIGTYENFDIFVDTLIPTKQVGDGSAITGHQSVAFGPYHLGEGEVMGAEPRRADETDYGRKERVIWLSIEAVGLLYNTLVVRGVTT